MPTIRPSQDDPTVREYLLRRDLLIRELSQLSDAHLITRLQALPPLADEDDPPWVENDYLHNTAEVYVALSEACAERRLRPSISLLLDRACYGDLGEIMRRLRHSLEAIVVPDWTYLADICLGRAHSPRKGTRLWAIDQLTVLDDPRARSVFEHAVKTGPCRISEVAAIGLLRLTVATQIEVPRMPASGTTQKVLVRNKFVSSPRGMGDWLPGALHGER